MTTNIDTNRMEDYNARAAATWTFLKDADLGDECFTTRSKYGKTAIQAATVTKVSKTRITVTIKPEIGQLYREQYNRRTGDRIGDGGSFGPSWHLVPKAVGEFLLAEREKKQAEDQVGRKNKAEIDRLTGRLHALPATEVARLLEKFHALMD